MPSMLEPRETPCDYRKLGPHATGTSEALWLREGYRIASINQDRLTRQRSRNLNDLPEKRGRSGGVPPSNPRDRRN
jgi:hypothetical protein